MRIASWLAATAAGLFLEARNVQNVTDVTADVALETDAKRGPMLFMLFMTIDRLPHQDAWRAWMNSAGGGKVKAFVHCKNDCPSVDHSLFQEVNRVHTEYCIDLVNAMNSLLTAAVQFPGSHPNDKFIFASESHIPVKSFSHAFHQLTLSQTSDFCLFPRQEWLVHHSTSGLTYLGVKAHQWVVLSREHGEKASALARANVVNPWGIRIVHNGLLQSSTNLGSNVTMDATKVDGCVDEYWYFNALFGTPPEIGATSKISGLTDVDRLQLRSPEEQGRCDTYVHWIKPGATGRSGPIAHLTNDLLTTPHFSFQDASTTDPRMVHPGAVASMSEESLLAFRDSPFLFARKIDGSTVYHNRCESMSQAITRLIVGAGGSSHLDTPRFHFDGEGEWLDNFGDKVDITTVELGRLKVDHSTVKAGNADGTYDCEGGLVVRFSNGVQMKGRLSKTSDKITWANNVVWRKNPRSFRGDGVWYDSQGGVVAIASNPPSTVTIYNSILPQWSGKGTYSGGSISVQFNEGSRLTASLTPGSDKIDWSHGLSWRRA
mmetsp:Transcript_20251/g.44914  ORF Transcript_20251/g.44914 Transcript_20251/m.44914 type:complete len:545 (-) Transcript_20251:120-1754(-)|eukprot:CAMPEP_0204272616 /NCGR_PEP_ID=MMETSP0468-20130131/22182_1 /ASSEMBLY_ACC=CAM_ASM_000383 /TAXON_ID=2969 /ORGANISM="Oxyrrhis marina" /LENGTH=544 /DNA_ID=CAMNT_0051248483 /DNA_START=171 /DNA_END=1805 /DNA_ORIENTATION=+